MGPGPSALPYLPAASMIAPVFFSAMIFPSLQCSYYTMSTKLVKDLAKCSYYTMSTRLVKDLAKWSRYYSH